MLEHDIRLFLDYLSVERGLAHNSILAYSHDLKCYAAYLDKRKFKKIEQVTREDISKFLFAEKESGIEPVTIARHHGVLEHHQTINDLPHERQHIMQEDGAVRKNHPFD